MMMDCKIKMLGKVLLGVLLCVFVLSLSAASCHAEDEAAELPKGHLAAENVAIGGIGGGSPKDYVLSIYGKPQEMRMGTFGTLFIYSRSFRVGFLPELMGGGVDRIEVTAKNGMATAGGIAVGMTAHDVVSVYGAPDRVHEPDKTNDYTATYEYIDAETGAYELYFLIKNDTVICLGLHQNVPHPQTGRQDAA